jgi:ornithine cyclodeaminase/alanine dehydrogenase-like protein (mu-crystallin family)
MTLHLDSATISELCTDEIALVAARAALQAQRGGNYVLPPRIDVDVPTGFFRVMPAALGRHMGAKVMTRSVEVGNRYLLLVYEQASGELVATLDAAEVTRLRTAATTAVAGEILCGGGTDVLGVVGTGFEADGHLRALAGIWPLAKVLVYSRSSENRESFAEKMSADLELRVAAVSSVQEVISACPVTVLCTKSTEPVVRGDDFAAGGVVLSIGSTRPNLRELDATTFARASRVLVDDPVQVRAESGDVRAAIAEGALGADSLVAMPDWSGGVGPVDGRDLLVFKSIGTAIQDLALAATLIESAKKRGLGRELGEITELKVAPGRKSDKS